MGDKVKTSTGAVIQRSPRALIGRRSGVRLGAAAVVTLVYALLFYLAAQAPGRPPAEGLADTINMDLFHGDAVVRDPKPVAEATAEPAPAKPHTDPVEAAATPDQQLADIDKASEQDEVLQQVLAAVSNTPSLDTPAEPTPLTETPPATAAYQQASRGGTACEITARVQDRLQATPEVHSALALIPRASRSVANAVMLWNGAWIDPTALGGEAAISPLQTTIIDEVNLASQKCQREEVRGPRFLTLMDENGTALIVLGTGVWHWSDLAPKEQKSWLSWLRF